MILTGGIGWLLDDPSPHHAFGSPFGDRQGDKGAAHAERQGEHQQGVQIQVHTLVVEYALESQQPE